MNGTVEPDLTCASPAPPSLTVFDCRAFVGGSGETCTATELATASQRR